MVNLDLFITPNNQSSPLVCLVFTSILLHSRNLTSVLQQEYYYINLPKKTPGASQRRTSQSAHNKKASLWKNRLALISKPIGLASPFHTGRYTRFPMYPAVPESITICALGSRARRVILFSLTRTIMFFYILTENPSCKQCHIVPCLQCSAKSKK